MRLIRQWLAKRQENKISRYLKDPDLRQAIERIVQEYLTGAQGVTIGGSEPIDPERVVYW